MGHDPSTLYLDATFTEDRLQGEGKEGMEQEPLDARSVIFVFLDYLSLPRMCPLYHRIRISVPQLFYDFLKLDYGVSLGLKKGKSNWKIDLVNLCGLLTSQRIILLGVKGSHHSMLLLSAYFYVQEVELLYNHENWIWKEFTKQSIPASGHLRIFSLFSKVGVGHHIPLPFC